MSKAYVTILGKAVRRVARIRGGGSALPGLFVERIDPQFIQRTLAHLPYGVAIVSGTNGKTTTTKMVVELLESQGLTVFTNRTGSNFTRGVAAALLGDIDLRGRLHADIAVLELDEAHAIHFIQTIPPAYSLLLNVMRDQLDRFGEIDYTTSLLREIARSTTKSVVLNREDSRIASIQHDLTGQQVRFFGLSDDLISTFPSDDDLHGTIAAPQTASLADVTLTHFSDQQATFVLGDQPITLPLKLTGIYNVFNAAAALAFVRTILGDHIDQAKLTRALSNVTPAFGRGETFTINRLPLELVLVKNPSGFRLGLQSFSPDGYATMIAINDDYADGRDMSWLWDVDFRSLGAEGVSQVSGVRAYDMALRLQYDEVPVEGVTADLVQGLYEFISSAPLRPKRIYCTYTAMLSIRRQIGKLTKVEKIG